MSARLVLLYLVGNHRDYRPFRNEHVLDPLEAVGTGGSGCAGSFGILLLSTMNVTVGLAAGNLNV